jgi:hypothetical protein
VGGGGGGGGGWGGGVGAAGRAQGSLGLHCMGQQHHSVTPESKGVGERLWLCPDRCAPGVSSRNATMHVPCQHCTWLQLGRLLLPRPHTPAVHVLRRMRSLV